MRLAQLEGRRIAVWGAGREGRAALAALAARLPGQALTLLCGPGQAEGLARSSPVEIVTMPPDAGRLSSFDVVIKSPGISAYLPEIRAARAQGTVFTSGTALWFAERPDARVIGVTGTKGKSTTASMIAHVARALGMRTALAGNIGLPLLELLDDEAELWVVELSSFQTADAGPLEVGVVTNLSPEHLDWHGSQERYFHDKLKLADVARTLVVDAGQSDLLARTAAHPRRVLFGGAQGWTVRDGDLCRDRAVMDPSLTALRDLPGLPHNARNACAALTALDQCVPLADEQALAAAHALAGFTPLPHRLQPLGERDGRRYIDDAISTTPEATLAALRSLPGADLTVILGGHDRGLDWTPFARVAAHWPGLRCVVQGANGPRIAERLRAAHMPPQALLQADDLAGAVTLAQQVTPRGGTVLLSPGAPSFDQFRDYTERGRRFAALTGFDALNAARIEGLGVA